MAAARPCLGVSRGLGSIASAARRRANLCQREIATAAELAEEVAWFLSTFNEVRPHES
jgi:hypothetical protein